MILLDARPDIATLGHVHTSWNWSVGQFPRFAMNPELLVANPDPAEPLGVDLASPKETAAGWTGNGVSFQPLRNRLGPRSSAVDKTLTATSGPRPGRAAEATRTMAPHASALASVDS